MRKKLLEIYTDGACSGNPGLAAVGVVIKEGDCTIKTLSFPIGHSTNNIAEYTALIYALQEALILKASHVTAHTDSELLYHQLQGNYKIKHENIKPLFAQIQHLVKGFAEFKIKHIPRTQNKEADDLAKKAIKNEQAKVVALPSNG